MRKLLLILIFPLLFFSFVSALEYDVQVNSPSSVNDYEGETIQNKFSATITNNGGVCDISCDYLTSFNTDGEGIQIAKDGGQNTFYFDVEAEGSEGVAQYTLTITCDRISSWNCWPDSESIPKGPYFFTYSHNNDGKCTTEREKCEAYQSFLKDSACSCSSTEECNPSGDRDPNNMGCQTYCGNGVCEKSEGENCIGSDVGGCSDCKKCDGLSCVSGSECEGSYCVYDICSNKPYVVGDNHCDIDEGEDNKNSPDDCACGDYERWDSLTNSCGTWCGNNQCEESEKGNCKADCDWCGDGECNNNEGCSSCDEDCGVCENTILNDEISNQTQIVIKGGLDSSAEKQKIISYTAIGLIVLVIVGYIIFKFVLGRRAQKKVVKTIERNLGVTTKKIKAKKSLKKTTKKKRKK